MTAEKTSLPPAFVNNSDMNGYGILRNKIDPEKTTVNVKYNYQEDPITRRESNIIRDIVTIFTYFDSNGNRLITQTRTENVDGIAYRKTMDTYTYEGTNGYNTTLEDNDADGNVDVLLSDNRKQKYALYDDDDNGTFDYKLSGRKTNNNSHFKKYYSNSIFRKEDI